MKSDRRRFIATSLLTAGAFSSPAFAQKTSEPLGEARTVSLRGRVICHTEELQKSYQVIPDCDTRGHVYALKAGDGSSIRSCRLTPPPPSGWTSFTADVICKSLPGSSHRPISSKPSNFNPGATAGYTTSTTTATCAASPRINQGRANVARTRFSTAKLPPTSTTSKRFRSPGSDRRRATPKILA